MPALDQWKVRAISSNFYTGCRPSVISCHLLLVSTLPRTSEDDLKRVGEFKSSGDSRDIVERMKSTGTNFVVSFGSQTGMAQDYASKLAKEGHSRYGLKILVANIKDHDYENMTDLPSESVAVFVLATYGEGESTGNAIDFSSSSQTQTRRSLQTEKHPRGL